MLVLNDPLRQTDLPRGCIATIGNFDGMHIGHQEIIRGVVDQARATGRPSTVITFDPHPLSIVAPDRVPKQILTLAQKEELLRAMEVDALLIIPFTHEFSRWTADRFIDEFLVSSLKVTEVRIGRDSASRDGRVTSRSCRPRARVTASEFTASTRSASAGSACPARSSAMPSTKAPCAPSRWPSAAPTSSMAAS
jgi:FAD synthase